MTVRPPLTFEDYEVPPTEWYHGHRDQTCCTLADGRTIWSRIVGSTSCEADLCRRLVAAGVPDQPW